MVTHELSYAATNPISKPDTTYADWRIGVGGSPTLIQIQSYSSSSSNGSCAATTFTGYPYGTFHLFVGTITNATTVNASRSLVAYFDGSTGGSTYYLAGCNKTFVGNVSSAFNVSLGSTTYQGQIIEAFVWNGVSLKYDF